jgi:hypothetical protein
MLTLAFATLAVLTSCVQSADKVPRVELALLATAPDRFNGKEVIVSGLVLIEEGRYMILSPRGGKARRELMYIVVDDALTKDADETTRRYLRWPEPYVVVTLRGRFMVAARDGFGHQSAARFKLDVHKVIAVEPYKSR